MEKMEMVSRVDGDGKLVWLLRNGDEEWKAISEAAFNKIRRAAIREGRVFHKDESWGEHYISFTK